MNLNLAFFRTAFQDAHSMAFIAPKSIELLIGSAQPEPVLINASTSVLVPKMDISTSSTTAFLPTTFLSQSNSLMCCGARPGIITLRDPVSFKEEHSMMAHYAGLEQMEAECN
jgi:hypothetical protein